MDVIKEKISQACSLLNEMGIDLWMLAVRETIQQADPAMAMVVSGHVTWQSYFLYTRTGDAIALVGNFDRDNFVRSGHFSEVRVYTESVRDDLVGLLERIDPKTITVNYSTSDPTSDGLTHGMYLRLLEYLDDTPYADRLISAEQFCAKLRSRKTPTEIDRLTKAAVMATDVWHEVVDDIHTGMSEIEIAGFINDRINRRGGTPSFETIVNAGDKTDSGHGRPTDAKLESGDLLHVDFGVRLDGFCSDIQRLLYFRRRGETLVPQELTDAFNTVNAIINATAESCRPGVTGYEVDALARRILTDHGYPEYQHALGHQLGRSVHDGGGIIGPRWERYGNTPKIPLELNSVFTLELEITLPGIGCAGLEEDVVITAEGARFLCPRQKELIVR